MLTVIGNIENSDCTASSTHVQDRVSRVTCMYTLHVLDTACRMLYFYFAFVYVGDRSI